MTKVEHLLREKMGLDAASIGSTLIQRTVRLRMKSLGLHKGEDYVGLLQTSPLEWNELVESVIVAETWFFRDREPFAALVRLVLDEWLPTHAAGQARLLSLPCSSGEEPYSLAMALQDAGLPLQRFHIDAVDISERALARARLGIYGRNSFRGKDLAFRDRYFRRSKEGYVLAPAVRRAVQFHHGNLVAEGFPLAKGTYDFIFCRNLLIYFDCPTQEKALATIAGLLAPSGVLFVGPAEQPLAINHGFVSAQLPMAFACRKAGGACANLERHEWPFSKRTPKSSSSSVFRDPSEPLAPPPLKRADHPPHAFPDGQPKPPSEPTPSASSAGDLEAARRLADAGRLKEAAGLCEAHVRQHGPSAQAFYLLGLVRDAAGDSDALDYYRKALYLEPDHYETLLQMALWAQKNGDAAQARTYKSRAQRTKVKT